MRRSQRPFHGIRALAAVIGAALVLGGCVGGSGATPSPTEPPLMVQSPSPTPAPVTPSPSVAPSATIETSTVYSPDDEQIADAIRTGADEAIPQLRELNDMDPQKLEDLFLPFEEWIDGQRTAVAAFTPTTCTADAVERFHDALDQYDDIREKFLAWRDWGAKNHAFPPAAPGQAVRAFEEAVTLLEATCPAP